MKPFLLLIIVSLFLFSEIYGINNQLTEQEKLWIAQNEIKVGIYPFYPPFAYIEDDESIIGLFPDLRELIKEYSGLRFKQIFYPNWEAYLDAIKQGEIDMIMPIIPTEGRKRFLMFNSYN